MSEETLDVANPNQVIEQDDRWAIVLIDHERARILERSGGAVSLVEVVQDEVAQNIARAGFLGLEQSHMNLHRDAVLHRHIEHVAERLFARSKQRPFERIVLAGLPESVTKLARALHPSLHDRIAARERWDHDLTPTEIAERLEPIVAAAEKDKEASLIALVESRVGEGLATRGFEWTAQALAAGKVGTLLIASSAPAPGQICRRCRVLLERTSGARARPCPSCGAAMMPIADRVAGATELAAATGARVVPMVAMRERLVDLGGIAALLRFA